MCRGLQSIAEVNRAADRLRAACLTVCADDLGTVLAALYNSITEQPIPPDMLDTLDKLQ